MTTLRVGDPLDKNTDVGAINSRDAAREDRGARRRRPGRRAPRSTSRRAGCPRRATGSRRPSSRTSRRATASRRRRSSARCSACSRSARPDEAVEKANNTPYGLSAGVWTEKGSRILWMARAPARRRRLGEHVQPLRPDEPVRRLQGVRLRPRGRPARARAVPRLRRNSSRLPVKKTYKLFIGGAFPRSESGRTYEAQGQNVARALAQGRARRGRRRRAARSRSGRGATAYNRGQVLYRVAEMMEARARRVRGALQRRGRGRALDRSHRLVRGLGRQAAAGARLRRTPSPGRTSTSRSPSRPASSRSLAPDEPPLLGLVSRLAPPLVGGNAVVALASETQPLAAIELAEAIATSDVPGGVVNLLTGQRAELAPWLASHMDVNAIDLSRRRRLATDLEVARRRERQARRASASPTCSRPRRSRPSSS